MGKKDVFSGDMYAYVTFCLSVHSTVLSYMHTIKFFGDFRLCLQQKLCFSFSLFLIKSCILNLKKKAQSSCQATGFKDRSLYINEVLDSGCLSQTWSTEMVHAVPAVWVPRSQLKLFWPLPGLTKTSAKHQRIQVPRWCREVAFFCLCTDTFLIARC